MDFDDLNSVNLRIAFSHGIVDELHKAAEALGRVRFGLFVDGFRSVSVLMSEDAHCAGEDNALQAREAGGFEQIGHADDVYARGIEEITTFRCKQRRHEVAEGDDALDTVLDNRRHDFFQVGHVTHNESRAGDSRRRFWNQIEAYNLSAMLGQSFHNMSANIAAAADDQDFHRNSCRFSLRSTVSAPLLTHKLLN